MTTTAHADPRPKEVMPPLDVRTPRPTVVRLRKSLVTGAAMTAASLVAGSLAWAFIVQPELRAEAKAQTLRDGGGSGAVRPSELVTGQPGSYAQLDQLPEPRRLSTSAEPPPPVRPAPASPRASHAGPSIGAEARQSSLFFDTGGGQAKPAQPDGAAQASSRDYSAVYNTHGLLAPLSPFELKAGAMIPAVMITGVDTARSGPVVATVAENVYDTVSGRHLIIPQGARLLGKHEGESRYGDKRAYLAWHRLILPNGKSLILTQEPGVDAQGTVGVKGRVDRRLFPLAVATLFAGAITTLGQVARDDDDRGGWLGDAGDAASIEAAQVGGKLIDRELDVRPSIRLRPGARVRVLITRDLILEPYRS